MQTYFFVLIIALQAVNLACQSRPKDDGDSLSKVLQKLDEILQTEKENAALFSKLLSEQSVEIQKIQENYKKEEASNRNVYSRRLFLEVQQYKMKLFVLTTVLFCSINFSVEQFDQIVYEKLNELAKAHHSQKGATQEALYKINVTLQLLLEAADLNLGEMLISSAGTGDADRVRLLLDAGANVEYQDSNGTRPLHAASESNHPDILAILIDYRADVDSLGQNNLTALHIVAEKGYLSCARILLDRGANIDARDKNSKTPLMKSVVNGHAEMVSLLVSKGAHVNAVGKFHLTALHAAAWYGCLKCVETLVAAHADLKLQSGSGFTALELAELLGHKEIIGLLKSKLKG